MNSLETSLHWPYGTASSVFVAALLLLLLLQLVSTALLRHIRWAWQPLQVSVLLVGIVGATGALALGGDEHAALRVSLTGQQTPHALSVGLWFDRLSLAMLALTTSIGFVVLRFGRTYVASELDAAKFVRRMGAALLMIELFVLSSSLLGSGLVWFGLSIAVHRLLRHYDDRFAARLGAKKKFLTSRLADSAFWSALCLLWLEFGTLDIDELTQTAVAATVSSAMLQVAIALLVVAALIKSAQFPTHSWLPDTMDAPTPVSALMHAGVVNAGAFLLLRCSALLLQANAALFLLVAVGGISVCLGTCVGAVQTTLKGRLGWSTIAQMGFLFLEIGLGFAGAAALHLAAHAAYKAHAFLWCGTPAPTWSSDNIPVARLLALGAGCLVVVAGMTWLVADRSSEAGGWAYAPLASVWALGMVQYLVGPKVSSLRLRVLSALVIGGSLWASTWVAERLLSSWFAPLPSPLSLGWLGVALSAFVVILLWVTMALCSSRKWEHPRLRTLHVHTQSGFYLGDWHDRLTLALWPERGSEHPTRPQPLTFA